MMHILKTLSFSLNLPNLVTRILKIFKARLMSSTMMTLMHSLLVLDPPILDKFYQGQL